MKHSETIGKISLALSKAQGQMDCANKSADNPFFKSKYADLHEVIQAAKQPLADNELCVIQTTEPSELTEKGILINTLLAHSSGEWFSSQIRMYPKSNEDQKLGGSVTYGRRYSYAAIVGVAQKDDDREDNRKEPESKPENKPAKLTKEDWEDRFELTEPKTLADVKGWRRKNGKEIIATIKNDKEAAKLKKFLDYYERELGDETAPGHVPDKEAKPDRTQLNKWIEWVRAYSEASLDELTTDWEKQQDNINKLFPEHVKELTAVKDEIVQYLTEENK